MLPGSMTVKIVRRRFETCHDVCLGAERNTENLNLLAWSFPGPSAVDTARQRSRRDFLSALVGFGGGQCNPTHRRKEMTDAEGHSSVTL
jgi:hypothetical protein